MSRNHRRLDLRRWARLRRLVFDLDGWRCRACGKAGRLECDHVRPLGDGGAEYDESNLQSLCRSDHILKTRRERESKLPPDRLAWVRYLANMR